MQGYTWSRWVYRKNTDHTLFITHLSQCARIILSRGALLKDILSMDSGLSLGSNLDLKDFKKIGIQYLCITSKKKKRKERHNTSGWQHPDYINGDKTHYHVVTASLFLMGIENHHINFQGVKRKTETCCAFTNSTLLLLSVQMTFWKLFSINT